MDSKDKVLSVFPDAFARREAAVTIICRPRTKEYKPAIVPRVMISDAAYTEEWAWDDAYNRIVKSNIGHANTRQP